MFTTGESVGLNAFTRGIDLGNNHQHGKGEDDNDKILTADMLPTKDFQDMAITYNRFKTQKPVTIDRYRSDKLIKSGT